MKNSMKYITTTALATILWITSVSAQTEQHRESNIKKEVFYGILGGGSSPFNRGQLSETETQDGMPKKPSKKEQISDLETMASNLESAFFSKSEKFWPTWDTSKLQFMLVNQSADYAILLNNQNPDVDDIGARIEYSARTIEDISIKVAGFGKVKMNGIDTYFYNLDLHRGHGGPQNLSEAQKTEALKQSFVTAIHEAVHVMFQGNENGDMVTMGEQPSGGAMAEVMRGLTYPIDIKSRYYRNETFANLKHATRANSRKKKIEHVRKALFFHENYLSVTPENHARDMYDYAEGMATYIAAAAMEAIKNPKRSLQEISAASNLELNNSVMYVNKGAPDFDPDDNSNVLEWMKEYYDIGSLAYALAIQLGYDDIFKVKEESPLHFLRRKLEPLQAAPDRALKKAVYDHYTKREQGIFAQKAEIDRVFNHPDNILIRIGTDVATASGSFQMKFDFVHEYEGEKASFRILTQEISVGDNRVKLTEQPVLQLGSMQEMMEAMQEKMMAQMPEGSQMGMPDGMMPEMNNDMMLMSQPVQTMIIPVNKNDIEINRGRLTVQTEGLILFDASFLKKGNVYTLIKGQ